MSDDVKSEIEAALAEAKTAVEGGDPAQMTEKTTALAQAAMKLGQAMYEQQQAQAQPESGAGGTEEASSANNDEDVVDAEFSEVEDEKKG